VHSLFLGEGGGVLSGPAEIRVASTTTSGLTSPKRRRRRRRSGVYYKVSVERKRNEVHIGAGDGDLFLSFFFFSQQHTLLITFLHATFNVPPPTLLTNQLIDYSLPNFSFFGFFYY
jgi:hypothetical protein